MVKRIIERYELNRFGRPESVLSMIVPAGFENFFIDVGTSIPDDIEEESFSPGDGENTDIPEIIKIAKERYGVG